MRMTSAKSDNLKCHNRVSKYVNRSEYDSIKKELTSSGGITCEKTSVKDIILSGDTGKHGANDTKEKYIVRFPENDKESAVLIKECTRGIKIKQIIEPINYETVLRIIDRSTKWLCSSISPLIRELGVKMTTERLRPDTVMSFERESFVVGSKVNITADSGISMCEYELVEGTKPENIKSDPVDSNVCLVQVNYERIIPESVTKLIGIKAN